MENLIYSLQEADIEKDRLTADSEELQLRLAEIDKEIEAFRIKLEDKKNAGSELVLSVRKAEGSLEDANRKKAQAEAKLTNVSTAKQLDAVKSQIESLAESVDEQEALLLELYEQQETLNEEIQELTGALEEKLKSAEDEKKDIKETIQKIAADRSALLRKRSELAASSDEALFSRYEKLYSTLGGQVLYDTEDMVCPGCGMALDRRLFNKMTAHRDEFYNCNSCSRLLRYVGV